MHSKPPNYGHILRIIKMTGLATSLGIPFILFLVTEDVFFLLLIPIIGLADYFACSKIQKQWIREGKLPPKNT